MKACFPKSFLLFRFLLCPLCFDLRILPKCCSSLPSLSTYFPASIFCICAPDMFLFAFCWCFSGCSWYIWARPSKVQTALAPCKHAFSTHSTDQNICRPSDKWKTQKSDHFRPRNWAKLFEQYENKTRRNYNLCLVSTFAICHEQMLLFCTNVAEQMVVVSFAPQRFPYSLVKTKILQKIMISIIFIFSPLCSHYIGCGDDDGLQFGGLLPIHPSSWRYTFGAWPK